MKYVLSDIVAAVIVWIMFMLFRRVANDGQMFQGIQIFIPNFNFYTNLFLFPMVCIVMHYMSGYYASVVKESKVLEFFTTLISSFLISFIIFFVLLLDDRVVSYVHYYYSLFVLIALLFFVTSTFRSVLSSYVRRNFRKKKWTINTLIIGTGNNALKIAGEIEKNSFYNTVSGFIFSDHSEKAVPADKIIGNVNDISQCVESMNIQDAIIALDDASEQKIFNLINKLYQFNINIQFTPRLYEILTGKARIYRYGINPLVNVSEPNMSDWEQSVKRAFDILFSFIALLLLSPLMLYLIIQIKRDSKGPVIYRQERIGKHGKAFNIYKFRTMYCRSENGVPKLSSPDDDRITQMGRIMRKYRIDEIPQFWNILKGDMSIVGPRPERKFFIDQIIREAPYYCLLYKIRPGLTSWGPIKIGYSDTIDKMIERLNFDLVYMENMSIVNDLKILISTFEIIFKGKGM